MNFCEYAVPQPESHLLALKALHAEQGAGKWLEQDVDFLSEAIKGLLGIAGAQLLGMGRLVSPGEPVLLHPLVTLLRGVAEACGTVSWLVSPWIVVGEEVEDTKSPEDWWNGSQPILARIELLQLEARMSRLRRLKAAFTDNQSSVVEAEVALERIRGDLEACHGIGSAEVRGSRRESLRIQGETMPSYTELVTMATEFSHGSKCRGSGMNPYPMFSGFAHANVEVLFSQAPTDRRPGMSNLFPAQAGEVRDSMAQGFRLVEAHYEMAAVSLDVGKEELAPWSEQVRNFIDETMEES